MLESLPMWLNYSSSAKKSVQKFLRSDVKDWAPVIINVWLQLFLQKTAQPVITFREELLFHMGNVRVA